MSQSTQNMLFRRRTSQPISWLNTEKLNLTRQNILQHKIQETATQETKARPGRLLRPSAWQRNVPIFKELRK